MSHQTSSVARIALCAALLAVPAEVAAAPPPPAAADQRDAARTKAEEGFKLFGADRWAEALRRFQEAEALHHAPTLVLYTARCQRKLGQLVAARGTYDKLLAEQLPRDAPAEFLEAMEQGKRERADLRGRIPTIQIVIKGVPEASVRAAIDGTPAPVIRERIEVDPGEHVIDAISERAKRNERRTISVAEGAAERVEFTLEPVAGAAAPPPDEPPPAPKKGSFVPGAVALGVGGASLLVGAISGAMSLAKVGDIKAQCNGTVCPGSLSSAADSARVLGHTSTATLVIGAAAAVAGVVLVVVRPGGRAPAPAAALSVGAGRLELSGSF